ncbi:hypothetical protein BDV06DRAFT_233612 [Aspergillus oleicola]
MRPTGTISTDWFTRLTVQEEARDLPLASSNRNGSLVKNAVADEDYRAGLSQKLRPWMHDEALPSSERLNLFANLYFSRFHSLLPVVHFTSFKSTAEISLLFLSIYSVSSLLVGSSSAVAQGTRLFERLNKAILASWELMLSHSCSDALSMVQAAIIDQTFAIQPGRPRDLVLADVLQGTVMAWARESDKTALHYLVSRKPSCYRPRGAVDLLHHEPMRKHRLSQCPCLGTDALETSVFRFPLAEIDNPFQNIGTDSKFAAYGVLGGIDTHVVEARSSRTLDEHGAKRLSNVLMRWWRGYSIHFLGHEDDDPFSLPVLWHATYMIIYANMDILERASGRAGHCASLDSPSLLSEPAIHVSRAPFVAALSWLCFKSICGRNAIDPRAYDAPKVQLASRAIHHAHEAQGQALGDFTFADVNYLHRLIDLLGRTSR